MKNPLMKRYKRELRQDFGKYLSLFLFLSITIGFISGFMVADNAMTKSYNANFAKYNIENGHFALQTTISSSAEKALEEKIDLYPLFYKNEKLKKQKATLRVYQNRDEVNKVSIYTGKLPSQKSQIAVDKLFASKNSLEIGDKVRFEDKAFTIVGLVSLSDYAGLFEKNADMTMSNKSFGVAVMSQQGFASLSSKNVIYNYSWIDKTVKSNNQNTQNKKTDDFIKNTLVQSGQPLTDFLPRKLNQAIVFPGEDMGSDKGVVFALLIVIISILAFIFAISTKSTIENEARVIGTLRASGYTRSQLLRHFLFLPTLLTLLSILVGNLLGYTIFEDAVASRYYNSYALPKYVSTFSWNAFIETSFLPLAIVFLVNFLIVYRMLRIRPLDFLRVKLKGDRKERALKLPNWSFFSRFRSRIILQNKSSYGILFLGICLSSILLLTGLGMLGLFDYYKQVVKTSDFANYQYILKTPVATQDKSAEKYAVTNLKYKNEDVTIYGIQKDSVYLKNLDFDNNTVYVSVGLTDKFDLKAKQHFTLLDDYQNKKYTFTYGKMYNYPASHAIFMSIDQFNKTFGNPKNYFNGYLSNHTISDLKKSVISRTVTAKELTKLSEQMQDSIGFMFPLITGFTIVMYLLVMYLLAKVVVEKNGNSISLLKILGYSNREISRLYNRATSLVVFVSSLIALPISYYGLEFLFDEFMLKKLSGWMPYYISWQNIITLFIACNLCYLAVSFILNRKINRIPLSYALKNDE